MEWGNNFKTHWRVSCQINQTIKTSANIKPAALVLNCCVILKNLSVPHQEDCVVMTGNPTFGTGKWVVKSCNDTNGFVCVRNVGKFLPFAFKNCLRLKTEWCNILFHWRMSYINTLNCIWCIPPGLNEQC